MGVLNPSVAHPAVSSGLDDEHEFDSYINSRSRIVRHTYAAHLRPYSRDAGMEVDIYLADRPFVTSASDTPANQYFEPRLEQPLAHERRINGTRFGGRSEFHSGTMLVAFEDRNFVFDGVEYTLRRFLDNFKIDGKQIIVKAIPDGGTWANGIEMFANTAQDWAAAESGMVEVTLRGSAYRLEVPVQPATFLGTGGLEGDVGVTGQRPPVCLGQVFNIPLFLLLAGELLYQVHSDINGDGAPIQAVDAVKIDGVGVTFDVDYATVALLRAASIPSGHYGTCLAEGYIRLGTSPTGAVTADVRGGKFDGSFVSLPGTMLLKLVTLYGAEFAESEIDVGSFANLDTARPYGVERYIAPDDVMTVADVFSEIMDSLEGSWGDTPQGLLQVGVARLASDDASSAATFDDADIELGSFAWLPYPADVQPAVKKETIGYKKNYAPTTQLAASVPDADKALLVTDWSTVVGEQALPQHEEARELRKNTNLVSSAHAAAQLASDLSLYNGGPVFAGFKTTPNKVANLTLGHQITISYTIEDVDEDKARVYGIRIDAKREEAEVTVLIATSGFQYEVILSAGAFTLTGNAITPQRQLRLTCAPASFALTGVDVTFSGDVSLDAAAGAFTLTGIDVGYRRGYVVVLAAGTFTLSGVAVGLNKTVLVALSAGAFTLTGVDVALRRSYRMDAVTATFTLTGVAASLVKLHAALAAEAGSFVLTGIDVETIKSRVFDLAAGTFTLTGIDATLSRQEVVELAAGSFALTGVDVGFPLGYSVALTTATFTLTGIDVGLVRHLSLPLTTATFALTGVATGLYHAYRVSLTTATFTLTGVDAALDYATGVDRRALAGDETGNRRVLAGDEAGNLRKVINP